MGTVTWFAVTSVDSLVTAGLPGVETASRVFSQRLSLSSGHDTKGRAETCPSVDLSSGPGPGEERGLKGMVPEAILPKLPILMSFDY